MLLAIKEEKPYKVNFTLASSGITVVEQLSRNTNFKGLNRVATRTGGRKREIFYFVLASSGSTVVELLTHDPKFKGLNLASFDTIGRKHQKVLLLFNSIVSKLGKYSPNNSNFNYFDLAPGGT
jgi:hypothetical protein